MPGQQPILLLLAVLLCWPRPLQLPPPSPNVLLHIMIALTQQQLPKLQWQKAPCCFCGTLAHTLLSAAHLLLVSASAAGLQDGHMPCAAGYRLRAVPALTPVCCSRSCAQLSSNQMHGSVCW